MFFDRSPTAGVEDLQMQEEILKEDLQMQVLDTSEKVLISLLRTAVCDVHNCIY